MKDDRERLLDIHEAIERIERYAVRGSESFAQDELLQVWVIHHLQIIGEATRTISADLRDNHPEIPWSQIIGMGNILVHHYFGVDVALVWSAVERELPALKRQVEALLEDATPSGKEQGDDA